MLACVAANSLCGDRVILAVHVPVLYFMSRFAQRQFAKGNQGRLAKKILHCTFGLFAPIHNPTFETIQ